MCLFPTSARLSKDGGRPILDKEGDLKLPCGKCCECISARALEWSLRCRHEISLHTDNCFITLTYSKENLPSHLTVKEPFQNFMKLLRKQLKKKLSYIVSHEYGSKTYRPHHHAIIFGYNPEQQNFLKNTTGGNAIYTAPELDKIWTNGFHSIGEANEKTAYYIASYALKGKRKEINHPDTGEILKVADTMDCSKRPGIGLIYFINNATQLIQSGEQLPRYYRKILEKPYSWFEKNFHNNKQILKNAKKFPNLIIDYEQMQKFKPNRSEQELLAKLVITEGKANQQLSEFRKESETNTEQYKNRLKSEINYNSRKKQPRRRQ